MRPSLLASVAVAAAVSTAGCAATPQSSSSANNFSGPSKDVAAAVDALSTAASKNDSKAVCTNLLSSRLVAELSSPSRSCSDAIDGQLKAADVLDLKVKSVTINGSQAVATVTSTQSGHVRTQKLQLVRERGSWRIAGLG